MKQNKTKKLCKDWDQHDYLRLRKGERTRGGNCLGFVLYMIVLKIFMIIFPIIKMQLICI